MGPPSARGLPGSARANDGATRGARRGAEPQRAVTQGRLVHRRRAGAHLRPRSSRLFGGHARTRSAVGLTTTGERSWSWMAGASRAPRVGEMLADRCVISISCGSCPASGPACWDAMVSAETPRFPHLPIFALRGGERWAGLCHNRSPPAPRCPYMALDLVATRSLDHEM